MKSHIIFSLFLTVLFLSPLRAQEDFPHPELDWRTIETEHFLVHFHDGETRTGTEVAKIAEEIYGPITGMYGHKPDGRVSILLRDHDDYSNGAAYFYDNKIEIWAPALDFELRGTHPWLLNVITHEFTHIVQIQTSMKFGRKIPGLYLQWMGYEAERRPDVLYGFPNVLVSYPLSGFVVPSWFAEGVAQYNHPDLHYDYWDSHRDMILRMYMTEGSPLSWEEMAVFGKTSLGNESAYNAGFSIVDYISTTYGSDKLREISGNLSALTRVTIDGAIEAALGKTGEELYEEWRNKKTAEYRRVAEKMGKDRTEGTLIEPEGFGNFYPAFSADGKKIAYISNKGEDFFGTSGMYVYDVDTRESKEIVSLVRSSLSFSPDGSSLYYAKATRENPHWSSYYDLYKFDFASEDETRLTTGLRAQNPKLSSDGKRIVFAYGYDGTLNVGVCDTDGRNLRQLTHFSNGEQVFTPAWSPDGRQIAFGYSTNQNQSLAVIDSAGSNLTVLVGENDARNPAFSPDGKSLYFSWDKTGIFNIYALDLETRQITQKTNVLGGAFLPSVSRDGRIVFASYTATGYKIAVLDEAKVPVLPSGVPLASNTVGQDPPGPGGMLTSISVNPGVSQPGLSGTPREEAISKPYHSVFSSLSLIPFVRFDNYNEKNSGLDVIKPGFYFVANEVLDKLSLFGGAAINRRYERDLFFIFEYRDRLPILYQLGMEPITSLELYNITRITDVSFPLFVDRPYTISTDVTYNLLEFDLFLRQKVLSPFLELKLGYTLSRYSADLGSFLIPTKGVSPSFHNLYLIGNVVSAQFTLNGINPSVDKDINPVGRSVFFRYAMEFNEYNKELEYDVVDGVLVPRFTNFNFHRLELQWNEHLAMPFDRHTLSMSVRRGTILGERADTIFHFYAGGFIGMKGYPFYAIEGNDVATLNMAYRFPLWTHINARFLQFFFTKLYGSFFADLGNAWTGVLPSLNQWRSDAGFELRLEAFSFYSYPTRISFSGAYGFDQFTRSFQGVDVTYGREWRFYLGVLFGFELNEFARRLTP
ncbi:MAG: biopolymer transporter Tol [Bacteroidota bacterium]